ncbi:MAG: 2-oxoacid:acceptor oxidoreductase family protein [Bacilli bacterium]|nr:2-oxoacid:acceptor oxidoreductase family protein [Bacilli bacterium]
MAREELRLTGSGGQGVILATIILADIALQTGKNVAQSQAYGPEARGGLCKAEVVISDEKIGFTKVMNPTLLLALTQASLDSFTKTIDENCVLVADSSLVVPENIKYKKLYQYPILATAKEKVGKSFTANIVAVGLLNGILGLASREEVKETVLRYIPKGTEEINFKALEEGFNLLK